MNYYNKSNSAMAIPIVLFLALALGITATAILRSSRDHGQMHMTSSIQLQAHFIARAGLQHAMLKTKLLQRELYDAVCLAQGRNPLFDFSQVDNPNSPGDAISRRNPGPIFLYHEGAFTPSRLFTPGFDLGDKWLDAFVEDVRSIPPDSMLDINSVLSLNPLPNEIESLMREPFTGQCVLEDLNIVALNVSEDGSLTNTAIVEMTVSSIINSVRGETWSHQIKRTIRVQKE